MKKLACFMVMFFVFLAPSFTQAATLTVKLEWRSGSTKTDLDLYIKNPKGEICNYASKNTNWGATHLRDDMGSVNSYSYESFTVDLDAMDCYSSGDYEFHIKHYSGPTVTSTITTSGGQSFPFSTSKGEDKYAVRYIARQSSKNLNVVALNQNNYSFVINGNNYGVGGCVPTTYAMMFDFVAKSNGYYPVSPKSAISKLLTTYAEIEVLDPYDPLTGTGVQVEDEAFVERLLYGNITFKNCSQSIGYGVKIKRESASGWNYSTFMTKVKTNIESSKPIAVSVTVFKKQAFTWNDYDYIGGHHMLLTGYDIKNKLLYANDTWGTSYSTWSYIDVEDYDFYIDDTYSDLNSMFKFLKLAQC